MLAGALSLASQGSRTSNSDIILRLTYSSRTNTDMRTFTAHKVIIDGSSGDIELYRFYHPITGLTSGETCFYRRNMNTDIFELAGQIQWMSDSNVTVGFGIDEVSIRDLRKAKKNTTRVASRLVDQNTSGESHRKMRLIYTAWIPVAEQWQLGRRRSCCYEFLPELNPFLIE